MRDQIIVGAIVCAAGLGCSVNTVHADEVTVTIENLSESGGFYFTPFWIAAHNGGFDSYDGGAMSSAFPGLASLAETGNTGPLSANFATSAAGLAGGVDTTVLAPGMGAPVFSPGESQSISFDVGDASINRYFSYASMVIPSNDLFVANGNPTGHQLFDEAGNFLGPVTILIYGSDVNDNGTEVNNALGDAAFSLNDGQASPEFAPIRNLFSDAGDQAYLDSFIGTDVATGETITRSFSSNDLIGRITIVPAPGAMALFGLAGIAGRRRRRA